MPPEATGTEPTNTATASAQSEVAVDPNALVVMKPEKFHFKKDKKLGIKKPTLELTIPEVTINGLVEALSSEDTKQRDYILALVNDDIFRAVREQLNSEEKEIKSQEDLDLTKLSLEYLANQPASERRGGGIGKEVWEEFSKDYLEVMPAVTGKTAEQTGNAIKLLLNKFQQVKTNKPVLKFLKEQLALWFSKSPNAEEFMECFEFLDKKADTLLATDEATLLANL